MKQKQLYVLTGCRGSLTPDNKTDLNMECRKKTPLGRTGPALSEGSTFGSLGRGLLWFLSSPRSHRRRAGLPFTAPLRCCCLAPRPAAGGKQGASQSVCLKCHIKCCKSLSLLIQELFLRSVAITRTCMETGAWPHNPWTENTVQEADFKNTHLGL